PRFALYLLVPITLSSGSRSGGSMTPSGASTGPRLTLVAEVAISFAALFRCNVPALDRYAALTRILFSLPHNGGAHSAREGAARGAGPPRATEPGSGAEPHVSLVTRLSCWCKPRRATAPPP